MCCLDFQETPMELIILSAIAGVAVFAVELYDYAF
jgi:hypothetical protein